MGRPERPRQSVGGGLIRCGSRRPTTASECSGLEMEKSKEKGKGALLWEEGQTTGDEWIKEFPPITSGAGERCKARKRGVTTETAWIVAFGGKERGAYRMVYRL